MKSEKMVRVSVETKKRLEAFGAYGETHNEIIEKLLDAAEWGKWKTPKKEIMRGRGKR